MELPDKSKIAKLQVEHNRIIWDQLNIGIKQLILYSGSLFPSVKNQTTFKGIDFAKLKSPILKRYMQEGGDEYGNPFEPNIFDELLGGFSEDDLLALSKPAYPIKEVCGQNICPTCTPEKF